MSILDVWFNGCELIANERIRQQEVEGYTRRRDDHYVNNELALAGAWYAIPQVTRRVLEDNDADLWPWDSEYFKAGAESIKGRIRELVKAGALIAAEIDRLQALEQTS